MSESSWEWGYNRGVRIEGGHILWYESPTAFDREGGACEQTFERFLANGPWYDDVPAEIVEKLTLAVREQEKARPSASGKPVVKTNPSARPARVTKRKAPQRSV